jgi:hypothetical protein
MAANANSAERKFAKKHPDLVKDVQHHFINYVKALQNPRTGLQISTVVESRLETENGYPKVPRFLPEDKLTKDQAVDVLRRYLTAHYSKFLQLLRPGSTEVSSCLELASCGKKKHVPFSMLEEDTHQFIAARYLPLQMTLKDPQNMTKGQIVSFLEHIEEREQRYGVQDAFRFNRYHNGMEMVEAEYLVDVEEPAEKAAGARARKAKSQPAQKSRKGKEKEFPPPNPSDTESRQQNAAGHGSRHLLATEPDAASQILESNIDPSLLAADTVTPPVSDQEDALEPTIRRIGDSEMAVLMKLGHPPVVPINGPTDGLPQYEVTTAVYNSLVSKIASRPEEQVQVPRHRGRPRKTPQTAEDSQGLDDSVTNPVKNTRSRARIEAVKKGAQSGTRRSMRQKK